MKQIRRVFREYMKIFNIYIGSPSNMRVIIQFGGISQYMRRLNVQYMRQIGEI